MARSHKVQRNEPCPCGSGKKYKNCCWDKGFTWMMDENGAIVKQVPLAPELQEVLETQKQRFIEKFGREPGPEDPVFFDVEPEHCEHEIVEGMKRAGIPAAFISAYEKTGLLVTESNRSMLSDADLDEWEAALDEFDELFGDDDDPGS